MSTHEDQPLPELRGLRIEQAPVRDLWPGIEGRIAPRRRAARWLTLALAASVVGAVTLGVWREASPPAAPVAAPAPQRVAGQVAPARQALLKANLAIVRDAEGQLQQALEQDPESASLRRLLSSMQQRRTQLGAQLAHPGTPDTKEQET